MWSTMRMIVVVMVDEGVEELVCLTIPS